MSAWPVFPAVRSVADAVRWACILEATAPKAGNVCPGKSFADLSYQDFIIAAEIAAACLADPDRRFSEKILRAVERTCDSIGTNVNLGIVLLLGPLSQIAHQHALSNEPYKDQPSSSKIDWQREIGILLRSQNAEDAENIFAAIRLAKPSGLGATKSMDVYSETSEPLGLVAAMTAAQDRDTVARQYATDFSHLLDHIVPIVANAIRSTGDLLSGITAAQIELLKREPDSLIARKRGIRAADEVRFRARQLDTLSADAWLEFDGYLRSDANRLNPGTTADLIAAALFVLLIESS